MEKLDPDNTPEKVSAEGTVALPVKQPGRIRVFLNKRYLWVFGTLLLLLGCIFGYHLLFGKVKIVYVTAIVERGNVESNVVAAGIVQPLKYVDVGAQTSGVLKSLKVKRGDLVVKGQLLAEIDSILAQTAISSAKATLENMTSQRALKEAQLILAKLQRNRNDSLLAHHSISVSDRDITKANYDVAFADSASLSAQMRQAAASVKTAKANLGYTKINAPITGEIVSISLLEGQTLNANQSAPNILRIAVLDTVTIWAQVSEADIVRVKSDLDVYFTILGDTSRWNGKVRQILPTPELINNVVFYDVLFDIPNSTRELKIQMTSQVFIVLAQAKGVLLIPTAAVGNANEGSTIRIKVLKENGKVEVRSVRIGIKGEISTEVKEGLVEKEKIVISEIKPKNSTNRSALSARKG